MASRAQQPMGTLDTALVHAGRLMTTRPDLALAQIDEVLRVVPGHPQALLLAGRAHRLAGRFDQAQTILVGLARSQSRSAATAFELGLACRDLGQSAAATAEFRRAVALKPDLAEAWQALADQLILAGDDVGGDAAHLAAVRASVADPELAEAALALCDDRLAVAEPLLRARLKQRPTDIAAIRMLAEVAARLGRYGDAETLLVRALDLAPGFDAARQTLARVLQRQNRPADALVHVDRLLAVDPANPSHAMLRAAVLVRLGDYPAARTIYETVLAVHPHQPKGWMSLGHVLKTLGHAAEAVAAYRRAVDQAPALGEAWWSLANLKTIHFSAADVAAMRAALDEGGANEEDRLHLQFALGKALEDAGDYGASFTYYAAGNAARRQQLRYDSADTDDQIARAETLFTAEFFAARAGMGCAAPDPIFIVGLPRAGSTLIEQILASHSQVEGTMELPDLMAIARQLGERRRRSEGSAYPEVLASLDAGRLRELGETYLAATRIQRRSGRPFFIDKMPNNWAHVGLIHLILPNAKIIDARRHPLGCCVSAWKQHFARGQGFSYDFDDLGRYYRSYVGAMAHIDAVLPGRVHRVIYEDMVCDTEGEVRRLLGYLGLDFEDACLRFFQNDRAVRTASSEQVRQPIFAGAVDHWRHFAPWLAPLEAALGPVVAAYPGVPQDHDYERDGQKRRNLPCGKGL